MALGDSNNILVGAAGVYVAPVGTARPSKGGAGVRYRTTIDADTNWRNVGFTQDGFEISNDPSFTDVEVDQLLDAALIFKDGQSMTISTTFAEATLENLLVAWGLAGTALTSTGSVKTFIMRGGTLGEAPVERSLIAVGNAPRLAATPTLYGDRVIHASRVLSVESSSFGMARADAGTVPVSFRLLPDNNGDYGTIVDYTVA